MSFFVVEKLHHVRRLTPGITCWRKRTLMSCQREGSGFSQVHSRNTLPTPSGKEPHSAPQPWFPNPGDCSEKRYVTELPGLVAGVPLVLAEKPFVTL